jgi:hypothetical protein
MAMLSSAPPPAGSGSPATADPGAAAAWGSGRGPARPPRTAPRPGGAPTARAPPRGRRARPRPRASRRPPRPRRPPGAP